MTRQRAISEVLFATSLWGFGFIATVWAQKSFTTPELLFLRFLSAFIFGLVFAKLFIEPSEKNNSWLKDLRLAIPGGIFLSGTLILQTIGLEYTSATKSGFLTSLYVVLIPLINHAVFKIKTKTVTYALALLACIGAGFLMNISQFAVNPGDLWTLACAVMASMHILYIGRATHKISNSFRFNNFQNLFCCLFTVPLLVTQKSINLTQATPLAWFGILEVALGSSLIAFLIQIRTQKILSVTTASMLFLLESPFAFLYAALFLKENLSITQFFGATLILLASYLTIRWEKP